VGGAGSIQGALLGGLIIGLLVPLQSLFSAICLFYYIRCLDRNSIVQTSGLLGRRMVFKRLLSRQLSPGAANKENKVDMAKMSSITKLAGK